MKKLFRIISLITCLCLLASGSALAAGYSSARLKDVAKVQGVRANQLMGYGWWWDLMVLVTPIR